MNSKPVWNLALEFFLILISTAKELRLYDAENFIPGRRSSFKFTDGP